MKHIFCSNSFKILSIFISASFLFSSCKHKTNFDELSEVSYATKVAPIIAANCTFSGCHGDSLPASMKLTSYDAVMNAKITAGSPEKSDFYLRLKSLSDEKIMPKRPYGELNEKQIQLIYVWIGQGAKNN